MTDITVRPYKIEDFDALLEIQKEAFPPPFPEDLLWNRAQIAAHTEAFPAGAMIAEVDGEAAGSATSLIIRYNGKKHTWDDVADEGYIRGSHKPGGDTLYGIDLCVRPKFRGTGVAKALYEARKQLVKSHGLKRYIAGSRIPGYHKYADELTAEEYVEKVKNGELNDEVLTFMLLQGLEIKHVLADYLDDEESCHYGVIVEWQNPEFS
ncbi:GNAT family N-acetyltransferase [Salisediminibacterium halotolerans]|uniref:Acetyltransferase (GNAT) family protein n=1 Tax=Salisediminibacterium halotolerans TaxID=517425 RepID=A0A1H9WPY1_9BACI|nr:GNAT family N-acetyltransferase [Salisediminibacterium haloalkalitolerans]SES35982.1 Acetyltransferase (GNAT) family protein [Salisediminibacterium haloalkalitolerans]